MDYKRSQSPKVDKIYCAPGNAGIAEVAECVDIKAMEFDKLVAHHVRIRRKTSLHLLHRITGYLVPIFMMAVNHLQLAPILSSHSRSHLQVLLRRAVPLLFLLRTNLDVEAIRMQAQLGKLPNQPHDYHHH